MKILLSNDDSTDSPFLLPTLKSLQEIAEVHAVIPSEEQSWQGKSMTRFGSLKVGNMILDEDNISTLNGSPADCVNIGLHHLHSEVDLVVAGVNLGHNIGLGYSWSSGTVGACLEGNICGKPAIAFSQSLDQESYDQWCNERTFIKSTLDYLIAQQKEVIQKAFAYLEEKNLLQENLTFNVNTPFGLCRDWQFVETYIGHSQYRSCFAKEEDGSFRHSVAPFDCDKSPQADEQVLTTGNVSISIIDIKNFGSLSHRLSATQ